MDNLKNELKQLFGRVFKEIFAQLEVDPEITQITDLKFGHYQCNNALKLAKQLGESPRKIAEKIVAALPVSSQEIIEKVEIAGPGFINLTVKSSFLAEKISASLQDERCGIAKAHPRQRIIVEFSSPNTAKELHVGHLRSTIIGDALARLFEFLGHDVLRLNHVGDWGTQFGMLISYMQECAPLVLCGKEETDLSHLMGWYRASKKRFDEDSQFKKRAQGEVVKLQSGDKDSLSAWKLICQISRQGYRQIYDLLDIKIEERGESYYNPFLPGVVAELESKGMITVSEGAKCIYLEGFVGREGEPLPMIIQKSDGGYNYDTTDMAALKQRVEEEKADRIIYVVDAGQSLHFQMLFKAAEKAGYLNPQKVRAEHAAFGVVLGSDGKKFKTRSGETEKLIDLVQEAVLRAKTLLQERLPEISSEELEKMASILGVDALKYADLSGHRIKDYLFSYDRMLKFEGNTAAFLLYSYVRIQSIKRKVGKELSLKGNLVLGHFSEVVLGLHIAQFSEALEEMAEGLIPHRLCEYLYVLAEKFNAFFRDCRVEGVQEEGSRLLLCEATGRVLKKGLEILGLNTLERM